MGIRLELMRSRLRRLACRRDALLAAIVGLLVALGAPATVSAAGAPSILSTSASDVTQTGATLEAVINPEGSETKYEFYLERLCKGKCKKPEEKLIGTGSVPGGTENEKISAPATGLEAKIGYSFWVVATNTSGSSQSKHKKFKTKTKKKK